MEEELTNRSDGNSSNLDTGKAERSVWLMKCPLVLSKSWQSHALSSDSQSVAKLLVSLDPLRSEDDFALQVIDNDRGVHMRRMPVMVGLISSKLRMFCSSDKKKTVLVKVSDIKRTRRDCEKLEDIIFKLFERQPNWTLKQLVQETDQPVQFLKEILNELCVYTKMGTTQGT
ncbi:unnamed protein product [Ilex paraguariensis]|uniref:TFIIF beta subunit HTH domain-containing protein n=1 Tax=Ilex paraguariensis TaxID=185542 RepID=A0ABC8UBV0_9AQUA